MPVVCLSGGLGRDYQAVYACGIAAIASTTPRPMALEACMENGAELVEDEAERLTRLLAVGIRCSRLSVNATLPVNIQWR
ncbi:MAG: glycerate 2-kinase [Pseudomonadota bacterium]|nr:glycerate 2-kinase [Pseudomonadota bacterium]